MTSRGGRGRESKDGGAQGRGVQGVGLASISSSSSSSEAESKVMSSVEKLGRESREGFWWREVCQAVRSSIAGAGGEGGGKEEGAVESVTRVEEGDDGGGERGRVATGGREGEVIGMWDRRKANVFCGARGLATASMRASQEEDHVPTSWAWSLLCPPKEERLNSCGGGRTEAWPCPLEVRV